jgi:hypothetical protein
MPRPLLPALSACLVAAGLVVAGAVLPGTGASARTTAAAPVAAHHFVTNLHGAVAGPRSVGFDVFDTGSSSAQVDALPHGVRALVWLGQKCPTPVDAAFRSTVRRLAADPKVFGYYLSDEPHVADCPGGPSALAGRAAYVATASHGLQRSFVVLSKSEDYTAFRTAVTHVDLVGLDPYPCSTANPTCDLDKIAEKVNLAIGSGIPRSRIVPVYQGFGQAAADSHYYNLPTATQMRAMLRRWAAVVPKPALDYTYGWGHQGSANPTLVDSAPLRGVLREAFAPAPSS